MPAFAILLGATASGKTSLCEQLSHLPLEFINADVLQMYAQLRIGNARPPDRLLSKVKHHLVGFLPLQAEYSSGRFLRSVAKLIEEISERGKWPVVVGGSPFYLYALLYGLPSIPLIDPSIRVRLHKKALSELRSQLQEIDPLSAARICSNDRQRTERAIEVFLGTGKILSQYVPEQELIAKDCLLLGLEWEREELYRRIDQRLTLMEEEGLREELHTLKKQGYTLETPAMKGIGYREFFAARAETPWSEIRTLILRNSRRLAKRQLTFYRKFPKIHWLKSSSQTAIEAENLLTEFFL